MTGESEFPAGESARGGESEPAVLECVRSSWLFPVGVKNPTRRIIGSVMAREGRRASIEQGWWESEKTARVLEVKEIKKDKD